MDENSEPRSASRGVNDANDFTGITVDTSADKLHEIIHRADKKMYDISVQQPYTSFFYTKITVALAVLSIVPSVLNYSMPSALPFESLFNVMGFSLPFLIAVLIFSIFMITFAFEWRVYRNEDRTLSSRKAVLKTYSTILSDITYMKQSHNESSS